MSKSTKRAREESEDEDSEAVRHANKKLKTSESSAKVTVKDGPYVESKEVVGGIYLIQADSYDHAVKLCQGHPNFRFGSIEVREIDFMGQPEG